MAEIKETQMSTELKSDKDSKDSKEEQVEKQKTKELVMEKKKTKQVIEKDVAFARGVSLHISPKQAIAVCAMIKGVMVDAAIDQLAEVIAGKRPVPMTAREVPHQKGKGISGARYPKYAAEEILRIVQQAKANAVVNGIENAVITLAKADRSSAPFKSGGRTAKRAHVRIEVRDKTKLVLKTKEKK